MFDYSVVRYIRNSRGESRDVVETCLTYDKAVEVAHRFEKSWGGFDQRGFCYYRVEDIKEMNTNV